MSEANLGGIAAVQYRQYSRDSSPLLSMRITRVPAAAIIARRRGVNRFAVYITTMKKHSLKTSRKGYVIGLWFLQAGGVKGRETGNFPPLRRFFWFIFFGRTKKMNKYPKQCCD